MQLIYTKLDGRHKGKRIFDYRVELFGDWDQRAQEFVEVREWCWDTFGPSTELDLNFHNPKSWAWDISESGSTRRSYYIYLRDECLTHFTLKWK
jgi:hypothetical protein